MSFTKNTPNGVQYNVKCITECTYNIKKQHIVRYSVWNMYTNTCTNTGYACIICIKHSTIRMKDFFFFGTTKSKAGEACNRMQYADVQSMQYMQSRAVE